MTNTYRCVSCACARSKPIPVADAGTLLHPSSAPGVATGALLEEGKDDPANHVEPYVVRRILSLTPCALADLT